MCVGEKNPLETTGLFSCQKPFNKYVYLKKKKKKFLSLEKTINI